jgi:hypothetical protein
LPSRLDLHIGGDLRNEMPREVQGGRDAAIDLAAPDTRAEFMANPPCHSPHLFLALAAPAITALGVAAAFGEGVKREATANASCLEGLPGSV